MRDDSATEILDAMYRALCRHGYADFTIESIADEADTSKSLIHYYYEDKETLLAEFLDFLYERYTTRLASVTGETPREELSDLLGTVLISDHNHPRAEFQTAMLEVKAQAPYDEAIQDRLVEFDDALFERIQGIVEAGIESGDFHEHVDPVVSSEFLVTAVVGARTRHVAVDHSPEWLYETMTRYAESHLLTEQTTEVTY